MEDRGARWRGETKPRIKESKIQRETQSSNTSVPDRNGTEPQEASNLFEILAFYFSKTGFSTGPYSE